MSGERWRSADETVERDPRRRAWIEHYLGHPEIARRGVTWGQYAGLRDAGDWNEYAEQHFNGRFKVEG